MTEQQLEDAVELHAIEANACISAIVDWERSVHTPDKIARYVAALGAAAVVSQAKAKGIRAHLDRLRNPDNQD